MSCVASREHRAAACHGSLCADCYRGMRAVPARHRPSSLERLTTGTCATRDISGNLSESALLLEERHEAKVRYAQEQTQWRKDIIAQREAVQERVRLENRDLHDKIDFASLIPEQVVTKSIVTGPHFTPSGETEATLDTFTRFFGFKKTYREKGDSTVASDSRALSVQSEFDH